MLSKEGVFRKLIYIFPILNFKWFPKHYLITFRAEALFFNFKHMYCAFTIFWTVVYAIECHHFQQLQLLLLTKLVTLWWCCCRFWWTSQLLTSWVPVQKHVKFMLRKTRRFKNWFKVCSIKKFVVYVRYILKTFIKKINFWFKVLLRKNAFCSLFPKPLRRWKQSFNPWDDDVRLLLSYCTRKRDSPAERRTPERCPSTRRCQRRADLTRFVSLAWTCEGIRGCRHRKMTECLSGERRVSTWQHRWLKQPQ